MTTRRVLLTLVAALLLAAPLASAAECTYADHLQQLKALKPGSPARQNAIDRMLRIHRNVSCFAGLLTNDERLHRQQVGYTEIIKTFEHLRTDKQAGSSSGTGGSTNIVSKGMTARVLSLAAEYGALRESVNNQVVTIQGSLEGVPAVLVRQNILPYCPADYSSQPGCLHYSLFQFLRRISYGVSFNTTQNGQTLTGTTSGPTKGTAQPVTFTASQRQLSSVTGRVLLWNARDATSAEYEKQWNAQLKDNTDLQAAAETLNKHLDALLGDVEQTPEYAAWFQETRKKLSDAEESDVDVQWGAASARLVDIVRAHDPTIDDKAAAFGLALRRFRFEEDTFLEVIANKPVLTFEFNHNRPLNQPATATFRLIFDKGISKWAITANGAVETYESDPSRLVPGAGRVRDAQFGMQVDRDLGSISFLGTTAITGSYYFQYQNSPAILQVTPGSPVPGVTFVGLPSNASTVFATKGNLHIGQLKLILGQSSVRFPVAVSYSSRTELITKPTWRAQIGINYDFDALFSK
jgi:hypothetical protein